MAAAWILALLGLAAVADASQVRGVLRHKGRDANSTSDGFVTAREFEHRLRVCNAYPYAGSLDVYRNKGERLTGKEPMAYKDCRDFSVPLLSGDRLEFKVGELSAGTFAISDLPNNDALLLLVIHRHDTLSTAVAFESHVFANLLNAQIAIINTYQGKSRSTLRIFDPQGSSEAQRSETLRFDSVVAVNQGRYEVALHTKNITWMKRELVALNRQSYVVFRTGVEAEQGASYDEELVVYPQFSAEALHSAAHRTASALWTLAALAAVALGWQVA
mmetsp:Transcript_25841/g.74705  ORF Transcript_25841/g.74705 Transcript_25841/m.74705 type:complete len:274 (+) Transcript_25841:51-872(+)|eukprot:CAMPEP_0168424912 /NCGR_PEP_ID=MMETSP0228-20121227/35059_1 /TAXON_ID=133427 /ORGANISM="Protoceratium reticulatum, Strain CCCM 535 (=CCMP 1889)" /LENGTH=273 /DNA_ID=CAMNT_0008438901 /DNA_START=41 /DNA_END=862 /DNA_ORIENTATION=+